MNASEGTVDPEPDVSMTGVQATVSLNSASISAGCSLTASGVQSSISLGNEDATPNTIASPTGIQLTGSIGNPNVTAWSEIDLGVNNTWTTVDLAA